jgi:hypothetical protein
LLAFFIDAMSTDSSFEQITADANSLFETLSSVRIPSFENLLIGGEPPISIISVGGCPSSGTTLVADLIDSTTGFACDPEIGIFCLEEAYQDWAIIRKDPSMQRRYLPKCGYLAPRRFFNLNYLSHIGLSLHHLQYILATSSSLSEFVNLYSSLRANLGKKRFSYYTEKTPGNVCTALQFLNSFSNGYYIHVVRDPVSTICSLLRRGFAFRDAAWIWLFQNSFFLDLVRHPRSLIIKYEDVLESPFSTVGSALQRISRESVDYTAIESSYLSNEFRKSLPRPRQWNSSEFKWGQISNTQSSPSLSQDQIDWLRTASISCSHLSGDYKRISMRDLVAALGYSIESKGDGTSSSVCESQLSENRLKLYLPNRDDLFN